MQPFPFNTIHWGKGQGKAEAGCSVRLHQLAQGSSAIAVWCFIIAGLYDLIRLL